MKIILDHKFGKVQIETQNDSADDLQTLEITAFGQKEIIKKYLKNEIKKELKDSSGFYGHTFDISSTTNLDLGQAVRSLPSFKLVSISPELIESKNQIPNNAQS